MKPPAYEDISKGEGRRGDLTDGGLASFTNQVPN